MDKTSYAGKVVRSLLAALLAVWVLVPSGVALAKSSAYDVDDASFTLKDVETGDVVHAYQIFDTDIDASNNLFYTAKVSGLPAEYDTVDKISAEEDGRKVADAIAATVIATSTKVTEAAAGVDGKATLTLDSGYYLVTVTSNSGNTKVYQTLLVNATPDVQDGEYVTRTLEDAAAKFEPVEPPTKKIVDPEGQAGRSTNMYSVGDVASFTITGNVPSYPADATRAIYSITDVPDAGLSVRTNTFVVKSGEQTLVQDTDYTLTANANGTYTVAFSMAYILGHPGATVSIDYEAEIVSISLETGMVNNKVYGTFTPNPYEDKDVDTDESDPWAETYGFSFKKLAAPNNTALPDAEFTVTNVEGTPVTYIDAEGTVHTDGKVVSDSNGWIYVNGLAAGTYTVSETRVPSGHQKVEDFTVVLNAATAKSDSPATPNVTETNFNISTADQVDPEVGVLPTTGSVGIIALTACGILLVVGGGSAVLYARRRRNQG